MIWQISMLVSINSKGLSADDFPAVSKGGSKDGGDKNMRFYY